MSLGFIDNFIDKHKEEEFHISGQVKVKTLQEEFFDCFNLHLRIYKSKKHPADGDAILASLKTAVPWTSDFSLKASMTIKEVEDYFLNSYGILVLIYDKDNSDKYRIPKDTTLGNAKRGKYNPIIPSYMRES